MAMLDECRALGEGADRYRMRYDLDFAARVKRLLEQEQGIGLEPGHVPQATFWLVRDGHIGYMIHPSERRKGYGTRILALALDEARRLGLERVLITCSPDNIGSARIIEKNGGIKDTDGVDPETGHATSRYWIEL